MLHYLILLLVYFTVSVESLQTRNYLYSLSSKSSYINHVINASPTATNENNSNLNDFKRWSNPNYDQILLNNQYNELGKALMTIGSSGVSISHINSLSDLLGHHERVRVKIASDKIDANVIANTFIKHEKIIDSVELLEIRKRGIMFGRKVPITRKS